MIIDKAAIDEMAMNRKKVILCLRCMDDDTHLSEKLIRPHNATGTSTVRI